jgi:CBS domain containing-hemolysin-like protein
MNPIWLVIICLLLSAYASGIEIAFVTSNKLRIELGRRKGWLNFRILSFFINSTSRFIATMLVANNIALTVYGIAMTEILTPIIKQFLSPAYNKEWLVFLIQTLVATFFILLAGEFIPKVFFRKYPNAILSWLAVPTLVIYYLLYPAVILVMLPARWLIKIVSGKKVVDEKPVFGKVDLDFYIRDIMSRNDQKEEMETEIKIFQNALDFSHVKVRECMIPRTEIVALPEDKSIDELRKLFIETQRSKILIYRDSIDNITGFVHSSELLKNPLDIASVIMPVSIVPESMAAPELLTMLTRQHKSIAIVVDEFGGTSGLVTLEDVMEEIFGEIHDEHDMLEFVEKKFSDTEFAFSGRLEIDYLNSKYNLGIPESDAYETLGGFILYHYENIPEANNQIVIPPFIFSIMKMDSTRIALVRMKLEKKNA